jgi:hypothetical protein
MKSFLAIVATAIALAGCASGYTYEGGRYPDKESFNAAVDTKLAQSIAVISPLPARISGKSLVFAIPSERFVIQQSIENFQRVNGRTIGLGEEIIFRPVWASSYKGLKAFHEAIIRRNIYQSVRYVELDTRTPDLQATPTEDAFFYTEAQMGAGQWYYTSAKAGKQAFAYDRGGVDMNARTKAFIDAIQIYAIRD